MKSAAVGILTMRGRTDRTPAGNSAARSTAADVSDRLSKASAKDTGRSSIAATPFNEAAIGRGTIERAGAKTPAKTPVPPKIPVALKAPATSAASTQDFNLFGPEDEFSCPIEYAASYLDPFCLFIDYLF